jgi:type VI protein secretion system component VasK
MSDSQLNNSSAPLHTGSFKHFEALESSQRLAHANGKLSQLPCQIVFFETATRIKRWFHQMGHTCPNADFSLMQADAVQLSYSEKYLFVFIPFHNVSLAQQASLKGISSWLSERRKNYPIVSVSLLLSCTAASVEQASGNTPDIDLCKRAMGWAESLAKKQLQRSVHLQFHTSDSNLPSLVLTCAQLSEESIQSPLETWRKHCLHLLDCSQTPWLKVVETAWLNSADALLQCIAQLFMNLSSSKRHGRACPPDVIALHPGQGPLTAVQLLANHSTTQSAWLNTKFRDCFLRVSIGVFLVACLYVSLGWLRQSFVDDHLSQLQKKSRQLDALNCTNIDSLEIADNELQHLNSLNKSPLRLTAFLFKQQTRMLEAASSRFNERIQRWSQRCLIKPVHTTLSELLERYVFLSNKKETITKSHEQAYQFLKTYLMFFQLKNLNAAFLREQSIQILKSISHEKAFDLSQPPQQQRTDRLLSHALLQPALSFPNADTANTVTVTEVRKILLANQVSQNAEAQIYGRIIDAANGQLQSVGLLTEIGVPTLASFENNPTILGAYTRGAFKSHVEGLIQAAAKGELEQNDWVLDTQGFNQKLQPSDSLRAQLEARYWKNFELVWSGAIQSVTLKPKLTSTELSALLGLFSDELNSPCRKLIQYLQALNANALFGSDDSAYRNSMGVSPQHPEGQKPFSVYAAALQSLSTLNQTQMEVKPEEFFSQHWSESDGPSAIANDWTQRHLGVAQSKPLQDAIRQFFLLPVQFWLTTQLGKSSRLLNSRWASDVLPRLKTISVRYPFNARGIDATPEEVNEFLSVNQGVVSSFLQHNLKGALRVQGEQWKVVRRFGQTPPFETEFLTLLGHLGQIRPTTAGGNHLARFELRPIPNPMFMEQSFALEGQQMRYRNGPQIWSEFYWRGDQPQHLTRFNAQTTEGENCSGPSWTGRMSWVRALETATVEKSGSDWVLSWHPCTDKSKKISFQYRHLQGLSPGDLLLLNHWPTPPKIFKEASF